MKPILRVLRLAALILASLYGLALVADLLSVAMTGRPVDGLIPVLAWLLAWVGYFTRRGRA